MNPSDPADAGGDLDHDGLSHLAELLAHTTPTLKDTDGDGINDSSDPNPTTTNHTLQIQIHGGGNVTSAPVGINCGNDCQEPIEEGLVVELTASPLTADGWSFSG